MGYEFIIAGTGAELRLRVIEEREGGGERGFGGNRRCIQ